LTTKGLSPSSINLYLKNLERLNDGLPLKDFKFLNDIEGVLKFLEKYKDTTRRGYLISIVSVLECCKDKNKKLNELYKIFYGKMIEINDKIKEVPSEKLSEVQANNWIDWDAVVKKYNELYSEVQLFGNNKEINKKQYEKLLELMVLALYRWIPPRRSEYSNMFIVKKFNNQSPEYNYLSIGDKKFLFNQYKTVKKYGPEFIDIPDELMTIIMMYLKYHPLIRGKKVYDVPYLIYHNGEAFNKVNSITRILNKVFNMKISSSMLRHIWNTGQYGDTIKAMKDNADKMGHSLEQAISYIKDDSTIEHKVEKPKMKKIQVAFA
jgi:hypothetical protein